MVENYFVWANTFSKLHIYFFNQNNMGILEHFKSTKKEVKFTYNQRKTLLRFDMYRLEIFFSVYIFAFQKAKYCTCSFVNCRAFSLHLMNNGNLPMV